MTEAGTARGGMAILAMSGHGQDARATSCGTQSRETIGCELAAEVLRSFGELRFRVNGSSMLPAVWPGDILCVSGQDATEALPGEIVLFGREGRLFAHRVVEVRSRNSGDRSEKSEARSQESKGKRGSHHSQIQNSKLQTSGRKSPITNRESRTPNPQPLTPALEFVTRGDSLDRNDAPVSSHELLGRVTAIERGAHRFTPRQSLADRGASWILRRSDLCTRAVLWMRKSWD